MPIGNIKYKNIIQKLFSYIYEDRKLKLVIYNKTIQNIININLLNYIFMSGKYVIYGSNGLAKEYDVYNDNLIFEGGYLNRKRNGKGKEYDSDGEIKFTGEYLNGKRNGKGNEYYKNTILFSGEYLKGRKWNGKGYSKNGNIIYELKNGNGFVEEYNGEDERLFRGYYKKGLKNGKGKIYDTKYKYVIFDGEFYNGHRWNGKILDLNGNIFCELKNGKGSINDYIEGRFINGELNGKIKIYDNNGKISTEGEYLNGRKHGKIKDYYYSELLFDGEYLYGHKKRGREYIKRKLEYEGEYLFDKKWNGKGYDENGKIIYNLINGNGKVKEFSKIGDFLFEGQYLNGKRNGIGKEYDWKNKTLYEGQFLNGKKNGKGKEYYGNVLEFEGEYLNGKRYNGKGTRYFDIDDFCDPNKYEFEYKNFVKTKERRYEQGRLVYDMEYINGKLNEKEYDKKGNIIYEIINGNGIKKEYNGSGKIIFEGEYKNGKLNGKVKHYSYNGTLIFEGEYLNDIINGKGKEYKNGELIFVGEYLNGKRWNGKGKEYKKNELVFEGEYLNGKRWKGKGKEYDWIDKIEFEGEYINWIKKRK